MGSFRSQTAALLLCAFALLVSGHGDEHMDMDMGTNTGSMAHNTSLTTSGQPKFHELYEEPNYFRLESYSGLMLGHILFMVMAWFFILPIGQYRK